MRKIEINLYPYSSSEKKIDVLIEKYFPFVFLGFLFLFLMNILLFFLNGFITFPLKKIKQKWEKISPQIEKLNNLKREINKLKIKKADLESFYQERVSISHIFADIFKALPKNMWLEKIAYSNRELFLSGYVVKWEKEYLATIDAFIKNLKKEEYFSKIFKNLALKDTRKTEYRGREVTYFILQAK